MHSQTSNPVSVNRISPLNSGLVMAETHLHVQRPSPLACLLLREFGIITGAAPRIGEEAGAASSFLGDGSIDCRELRPDVVRGKRLLVLMLEPFIPPVMPVKLVSSLLPIRNGIGPLKALRCRPSRSAKKDVDWEDRLLVGVGGIDWADPKLGGVVEVLVRRPGRLFPPLLIRIS